MSIGNKLGRVIGASGALVAHGVVAGFEGLGTFGTDVVSGIEEGYEAKAATLALPPEQRKAMRDAARAEMAQRAAPIKAKTAKAG